MWKNYVSVVYEQMSRICIRNYKNCDETMKILMKCENNDVDLPDILENCAILLKKLCFQQYMKQ